MSIVNNYDITTVVEPGPLPVIVSVDPSTFSLGTGDASDTVTISSDRLMSFTVSLTGDASTHATVTTELGGVTGTTSTIGASTPGQDCVIRVTKGTGTGGVTYTGDCVITDDTGTQTLVPVSVSFLNSLKAQAQAQGAVHIWDMDTAGTSQPNYGSVGTPNLTLTVARTTSAQTGTSGALPITVGSGHRGTTASTITNPYPFSVVLCANFTSVADGSAVFGGTFGDANNAGYILVGGGNFKATSYFVDYATIMPATTGVHLLCFTVSGVTGTLTTMGRKLGGARVDNTGTRGASFGSTQTYYVGGNGSNFNSTLGSYYFCAIYNKVLSTSEFDTLYNTLL